MQTKILLDEEQIPKQWYNVQADLPSPLDPPLHPQTHKPIGPADLSAIFPAELIRQEVTTDRHVNIPEEVRDVLRLWRPSPLYRAHRLEKFLKTPAKIYYKWEGVSPAGSHKTNSSVPQAYYNMKAGMERLSTETGAGQWGSALAFATMLYDLECTIYMVRSSYTQKPYRKSMMKVWGAECIPSPSTKTKSGRAVLEKAPETPGSLGIAISEAVEDAASHSNTNYALGSVLNHVCLHQTVIGLEAQKQLKLFFQLGLQQGCPRDQLLNFSNAGIILQPRQLAASAAARLCDHPDGASAPASRPFPAPPRPRSRPRF